MATTVDAKLLKTTKFPTEFNQKVDMQKVNLEVMKKWIAGRIAGILQNEDDVVIELCFNLMESSRYPEIKKLQIQLTGFLEKETPAFCLELWKLCLSAQSNPQGVPKELLEAKKLELIQEKIEAEKAAEEARRRRDNDTRRDRDMESIRDRERGERGRGGGRGDSWRGGGRGGYDRGGRNFDRRGPRRSSRSPVHRDSRDRGDFRPAPRDIDSYTPGRGGGRRSSPRRRRSSSTSPAKSASRSRSRTPRRRRSRANSRSSSPPRRQSSVSRSRSPIRRRSGRDRSPSRGARRRSYSSSISRSRSPPRKRRRSETDSISRSPPAKSRRSRRNASSISRSPSPGVADNDLMKAGSNGYKGRGRDERRLTRSNSRSLTPPRRRRYSTSRSRSRSPRRRSRLSIERRGSSNNRRRNTSSASESRDRRADDSEDDNPRTRKQSLSPSRDISMEDAKSQEVGK